VFNLYVPASTDSVLAVLGGAIDCRGSHKPGTSLPGSFRAWLAAGYLVPWFTQPLARLSRTAAVYARSFGLALYPLLF